MYHNNSSIKLNGTKPQKMKVWIMVGIFGLFNPSHDGHRLLIRERSSNYKKSRSAMQSGFHFSCGSGNQTRRGKQSRRIPWK